MGNEMTPVQKARVAFDTYAALDDPLLPNLADHDLSSLQVHLVRWQVRNFGGASAFEMLAGATEELGELAHAILKHHQKIRGYEDEQVFREDAGDAIADVIVYLTQLCTLLRLDLGVLFTETAKQVMERDWKQNPSDAHKWTSPSLDVGPVCSTWLEDSTGACVSCGRPRSAHPGIVIR